MRFGCFPWWHPGTLNLARVSRDCMAVTAACMLTPRKLFVELGGFDEARFAVAYNDADYGYRLADAGYRSVYCAEAELLHHEGSSRGFIDNPRESRRLSGGAWPSGRPVLQPALSILNRRPSRPGRRSCRSADTRDRCRPGGDPHNLNCEGAPMFERDLLSRLKAAGAVDPVVVSPCDGPLRAVVRGGRHRGPDRAELGRRTGDVSGCLSKSESRTSARIMQQGALRGRSRQHAAIVLGGRRGASGRDCRRSGAFTKAIPGSRISRRCRRPCAAAALACLAYPYRVVFTAKSSARVWAGPQFELQLRA